MNVSNDSYCGDVLPVEKGNKNLESNLRKFKNLWVRRECYLHTLWQAEELPSLYENNEVIVPENITFPDSLIKKYIKRFSKSRKIDRKRITGHLQGKSEAISFVSVKANKPKTAPIENKLYQHEIKKFQVGRTVLINKAFEQLGSRFVSTEPMNEQFAKLPFVSELWQNDMGIISKRYFFKNHSIVHNLDTHEITAIFQKAIANSTFCISISTEPVKNRLFYEKLSIYLIKRPTV